MSRRYAAKVLLVSVFVLAALLPVTSQSFRVQCPTTTITHPTAGNNNSEPAYNAPSFGAPSTWTIGPNGYAVPATVNGAIKCQQISGGDGYATMGDGTQTYMFSFGPLSGLADIAHGLPGTEFPSVFNRLYTGSTPLRPGDPDTTGLTNFTFNGAV